MGSVKASPLPGDAPGVPLSDQERAEAELVAAAGEHWATGGDREKLIADARLIRRSLRWRTDANDRTFKDRDPLSLTALEISILKLREVILDKDPHIAVGLGVRTLMGLEAQNQRDDLGWDPFKQPVPSGGTTINNGPQVVFNIPPNGRGPG